MKVPAFFNAIIILSITFSTQSGYSHDIISKKKKILILHSIEEVRPWCRLYNDSFLAALKGNTNINADVYIEYLDLIRFNSEDYKDILEKLIRSKYQKKPPDIIVVTQIEAVRFVFERKLLPEVPKVLVEIKKDTTQAYYNSTTITNEFNFDTKLKHALGIFPQTKEVYVVAGYSKVDYYALDIFKAETRKFNKTVSFKYLTDIDRVAVLDSIRNLPENSFVYFLLYTRDLNGEAVMARDFCSELAVNSNRPVFTFQDLFTGETGIFGGMVTSLKSKAEKTVEIIEQVFNGQNIESIPPIKTDQAYVYNWKELKKWNIDIEKLPKESIFYNRTTTFFEQYKYKVIMGIVILSLYTLLLLLLLYSNRKRKKSEKALLLNYKELQKVKEKAEENEKKFELIVEYTYDWETYYDDNLNIVFINQAFEKITGYNKDDFKSKKLTLKEIVFKGDIDKVEIIFSKIYKGETINSADFRITHKNKQIVFVEVCSQAIFNINKDFLGIRTSIRNISERKLAEIELLKAKAKAEESDRLKTAFLQNMSHEIRTPMNAIMGFSELLVKNYGNKQKLEHFSGIINQRCSDLLDIINDILDISKIESGQLPVNMENCNIVELFTELNLFFKGYQKKIEKQHLDFSMQYLGDKSLSVIQTDKLKLKQILINLISNAFKFTENGSIDCGCKLDNNQLIFFVSDTGIGIPQDKHDIIFERFTQLNNSSFKNMGGTGLGLSIVKGLTGLLGGKIWIDSNPDKGTTFYFSINYIKADFLHHIPVEINNNNEINFYNKTILIVEDDLYNAEYLIEILANNGVNILVAEYAERAIQIVKNQPVDLILMDICLPDMDGYEATRNILKTNGAIKVIAQTAYAAQDERQKAMDAGCIDYISKPTKAELLMKLINKYLTANAI
jgi:PAS domain S-box-containing protein